MNLMDATRRLVETREFKVEPMARAIGISPRWYYNWRAGEVANPGVNTIQAIHDYLLECPVKPGVTDQAA